ncbi:hypothetical protein [Planctobacterium marinum]|uniref:hypothetical protein n=1 Tax=Planctobacterium marinum TaxID=1631968 RepID=UPI001E64B8E2|nr:hypothetical protein [Planctobacterium marinum]MCC2606765.1 hypothetical protein [Planctobacterium marinum]
MEVKAAKIEESDFDMYLKRSSGEYRKFRQKQNLTVSLAILGTFGSIYSFFAATDIGINFDTAQLVFFLIIAVCGLYFTFNDFVGSRDPHNVHPPTEGYWLQSKSVDQIKRAGQPSEVALSDILPSSEEQNAGFDKLPEIKNCQEHAFVSEDLDNLLLRAIAVPMGQIEIKKYYLSGKAELKTRQIKFLSARIKDKKKSINEVKLRLGSSIAQFIKAINGKGEVNIEKVTYFDGLVTNEAFRSILFETLPKDDEPLPDSELDLTRYYPAEFESGAWRLGALPSSDVSQHIGISTIAITKDNRVVIFKQNKNNIIGANTYVASGSGSMDYNDKVDSGSIREFIEVIKFSMARELCEETGAIKRKPHVQLSASQIKEIKSVAATTWVTGFFRWVNRCGKPEFVGVTKLNKTYDEIEGDRDEVSKSVSVERFSTKKLAALSDIRDWFTEVNNLEKVKYNLSCYAAIRRLVQIASYIDSEDAQKKSNYDFLNAKLFNEK